MIRQHDRQSVRLLAGGTARAPGTDLLVLQATDFRYELAAEQVPGVGVSIESRHVDGDRILQPLVLGRAPVEYSLIGTERLHPARTHSHSNAASQALVLVPVQRQSGFA